MGRSAHLQTGTVPVIEPSRNANESVTSARKFVLQLGRQLFDLLQRVRVFLAVLLEEARAFLVSELAGELDRRVVARELVVLGSHDSRAMEDVSQHAMRDLLCMLLVLLLHGVQRGARGGGRLGSDRPNGVLETDAVVARLRLVRRQRRLQLRRVRTVVYGGDDLEEELALDPQQLRQLL